MQTPSPENELTEILDQLHGLKASGPGRHGTRHWIERHEKGDLIRAVIASFVERRKSGSPLSFRIFTNSIMKPKFDYPYSATSLYNYVRDNCA